MSKHKRLSKHQARVLDLMQRAGQKTNVKPTVPSREEIKAQLNIIMEEVFELLEACGFVLGDGDWFKNWTLDNMERGVNIVEVADAIADISVTIHGLANRFGITMRPILKEVDKNNLAKFGPGHSYREDGKLIKPPNHQPPDIEGCLRKQGWEG